MTRTDLIAAMTAPFETGTPWYELDVETIARFVNGLPEAQFAELAENLRQQMNASLREYGFGACDER